jgi:hypothetical protein
VSEIKKRQYHLAQKALRKNSPPQKPVKPTAQVRKGVRRKNEPSPLDTKLFKTADDVIITTDPNGNTSFDITIKHEVFADLNCRIQHTQKGLVATFVVKDTNLRRLLQAQAGLLRQNLEERGLKVVTVVVTMHDRDLHFQK